MNLKSFIDKFRPKNRVNDPARGMQYMGGSRSLFAAMHSDAFASSYPSIRAIANEYMTVRPYAIDKSGKEVKNNDIVNALYHPNQSDSSVSFFEKIAVSTLSLSKTYILVWRREGNEAKPGGDFTSRGTKIAGFTFLEFPSIERRDGKTFYSIGSQTFTENEVIVLPGGVNPFNLYGGYSPSEAARRWAKLDDYVADFQAGFFENGAVPAGQFLITAPTVKEFNDTVAMLEERHRGAGKNGNTTYVHRPIDPESGKPAEAQIEWIPYAQKNKDIDFKNLFDQVNKRIDVSFGVPQIVKGVDDAATYANAQVAERGFSKRAVYPLLLRNYTQITHELNRITNGMGLSITFNYEIPSVADEDKVVEETANIRDDRFIKLKDKGYSTKSIKRYFDTGDIEELEKETSTETDDADVDEGGEITKSPDPSKIDGTTPLSKGAAKGKNPKAEDLSKQANQSSSSPKAELTDKQKIEKVAKKYMQAQIDRAIDNISEEPSNAIEDPTDSEKQDFVDEMLVIIVARMTLKGEIKYEEGIAMLIEAGINTDNLEAFKLSDTAKDSYQAYLGKVGESYGSDTAKSIRAVLTEAQDSGFTIKETEKALKDIVNTDQYRITRLSTTETGRSLSLSGVEAMKQIQDESGVVIEKSLNHPNGAECEFCRALEGVWQKVDQPLVQLGETIEGEDGGKLINDFVSNEGYDPHPNGKGTMIYRVSEA